MIDNPRPDSGRIPTSSDTLLCYAKTALVYEELRAEFEAWASVLPRGFDIRVFNKNELWPGQYRVYETQCAWEGYKAGRASLAANAPAAEPAAWLWQHKETGRTRVVMPDQIITTDGAWSVVGPLFLGAPPALNDQWMPIETAPKDGTPILLRSRKGRVADGVWMAATNTVGGWIWAYIRVEPIEWMRLPTDTAAKAAT